MRQVEPRTYCKHRNCFAKHFLHPEYAATKADNPGPYSNLVPLKTA